MTLSINQSSKALIQSKLIVLTEACNSQNRRMKIFSEHLTVHFYSNACNDTPRKCFRASIVGQARGNAKLATRSIVFIA